MSDEQRSANLIEPEPPAAALTGEALRIEHARLSALIEHEDAVAKARELIEAPPRPPDEVIYDLMYTLVDMTGNHPRAAGLVAELKRAYGK